MRDTDAVRAELVDLWGQLATYWGVTPTAARVYAALIGRAEAQDADALMEALGASRGAVSMACRELRDWGLVHEERPGGSRRVLYRPETDLEAVVRAVVETRKRREWDPLLRHLDDWIPRLGRDRGAEAVLLRDRLREVRGVIGLADDMARKFLDGRVVQRLGLKALAAAARTRRAGARS